MELLSLSGFQLIKRIIMIKVLITDDHPVVRKGIRQILEDDDRISLINEAGSGKEMLNMLLNNRYDIILLDISLPGRSGLEMIGQIKEIQPSTVILILSMHTEYQKYSGRLDFLNLADHIQSASSRKRNIQKNDIISVIQ